MSINPVSYLRLKRMGPEGRELLIAVEVDGKYYRTDLPGEIHEVDIPGEGWEIFDAISSRVRSPYSSQGPVPEPVPTPPAQAEVRPSQGGESVQPEEDDDQQFSPIHTVAMNMLGYHGSFLRAMKYVEHLNTRTWGRAATPFLRVMSSMRSVENQISTARIRAGRVESILQGNEGWPHYAFQYLPTGHIQKLMLLWLRAHGFRDAALQEDLFPDFQEFKLTFTPQFQGRGVDVDDL